MLHLTKTTLAVALSALTLLGQNVQAMTFVDDPPEKTHPPSMTSPLKSKAADANNPLARISAISLHNIYTPSFYGMPDVTNNLTWIRYAQPIGRFLLRASLPISTLGPITTQYLMEPRIEHCNNYSGLSDFNFFITYIATKPTSRMQFGFGPLLTCPTATETILGTGKWSAGLALIGYYLHSPQFQCGFLINWQHSFAGDKDRNKVHGASFQPFLMWQLGQGLYLRSTGITLLDFENDNYQIPLGLGIGKVVPANKLTFNLFAEPQFTVWHYGTAIPKFQIFIGMNTQF